MGAASRSAIMSDVPRLLPRFLVLEGIDGSGTTTQCRRVAERLRARGHRVHTTREPSAGPLGRLARELLAAERSPTDPAALALLFAGDRIDHLTREIVPALAAGQIVLCDRYLLSSWVYQSLDCDPAWVRSINAQARWPDLSFVLALDPAIALARVAARRSATGQASERFDAAPTQQRLAAGYAEFLASATAKQAVVAIDAAASLEAVTEAIVARCVTAGL